MPTRIHFDIPVDDVSRAQNFYSMVFGWDMKKMKSMINNNVELWMCETQDERGMKSISGGLMKRKMLPTITNYIEVACIDEYVQKITPKAGKLLFLKLIFPVLDSLRCFLTAKKICLACLKKKQLKYWNNIVLIYCDDICLIELLSKVTGNQDRINTNITSNSLL